MLTGLAVSVQAAGAQVPAYTPRLLQCARFRESIRTELRAESAGRARELSSERDGHWVFRATPAATGLALEGWFDSLSIQQQSGDTTLEPETDGLIGGRYRGVLSRSGAYRAEVRPFVPDEIAEITDAAAALDDLFPPLPPRELRPGEEWQDSIGTRITRLPDSSVTRLQRYAVEIRRQAHETVPRGDTLPVALRQTTLEAGRFVWDPVTGLVSRSREITVETSIPARGRIRRPVRSRLVQTITLHRLGTDRSCEPSR